MTTTALPSRRTFFEILGGGLTLCLPTSVGCSDNSARATPQHPQSARAIPRTPGANWDPISFNRDRGNEGAIPSSYLAKINGPDGVAQHLGKHLPFAPSLPGDVVPKGMLGVMWGDPSRGYARHPNARMSSALPTGHWYDWVRVRKATEEDVDERESRFSNWPTSDKADTGALRAQTGNDVTEDDGKNTVYVLALPANVRPGDLIRIHAHCLTHGEYVDFLRVPT